MNLASMHGFAKILLAIFKIKIPDAVLHHFKSVTVNIVTAAIQPSPSIPFNNFLLILVLQ